MFNINPLKYKFINSFVWLGIINLVLLSFVAPGRAEKTEGKDNYSDYGLPTHRRDGGSRGINNSCITNSNNLNLVALIPEETVGVNAAISPKLFFYVPKVNKQKTLEFVLRNQQDELIYEAFLTTEGEGIMSVDIPRQVQENLRENDANYHWYLSMICNPQQRSRDIVVEGWMRQSEIDSQAKKQLAGVNSVAQAEIYHQKGFWYDALAVLADNYQSEVEKPLVRAKWSELLTSVGLSEVAKAPFIESEILESSLKN